MKKEVYQLLNNLESRIGTAGQRDLTQISRGERHEIIKGHAVRWLSGLDPDDRCKVIDEATLAHVNGGGYRTMESRSGLEQQYGSFEDWPAEVRAAYLREQLISWMSHLEPAELQAVDEAAAAQAAKEGADKH